jgi:hypothetical protein
MRLIRAAGESRKLGGFQEDMNPAIAQAWAASQAAIWLP